MSAIYFLAKAKNYSDSIFDVCKQTPGLLNKQFSKWAKWAVRFKEKLSYKVGARN